MLTNDLLLPMLGTLALREKRVLDAIEDAFAPYVKDRGLDWEIHIEQVRTQQWPALPKSALSHVACISGRMSGDLWATVIALAKISCMWLRAQSTAGCANTTLLVSHGKQHAMNICGLAL